MDACIKSSWVKSDLSGPYADWLGSSESRDQHRISLVIGLFNWSRPSAIGWLVVAVRIVALNRVLRGWACSHISKKALEREPSVANGNSSAAIFSIEGSSRTSAATKNIRPCLIFWRAPTYSIMAMLGPIIALQASARLHMACAKVSRYGDRFSAAVANAIPSEFSACGLALEHRNHRQLSETPSRNILKFPVIVHATIIAGGPSAG